MSDSENQDGQEEQFTEYAADMCGQLALIANGFGLETLGCILTMAALEARPTQVKVGAGAAVPA
jgi:hypothetical protein